jgi:hypothetical protein
MERLGSCCSYWNDSWELLRCPSCSQVNLYRILSDDSDGENTDIRPLYPDSSASKIVPYLPPDVRKEYVNALQTKRLNANAFAGQIGRVLEAVFLDLGTKDSSLESARKDLKKTGKLPPEVGELVELLTQLRHVGAHKFVGDLTEKDIPILDDLCRSVLVSIYVLPFFAKQAKESLSEARIRAREVKGRLGLAETSPGMD